MLQRLTRGSRDLQQINGLAVVHVNLLVGDDVIRGLIVNVFGLVNWILYHPVDGQVGGALVILEGLVRYRVFGIVVGALDKIDQIRQVAFERFK